ncbi:MAG: RHS repeat-associated core domain-containing protein [Ktedonobacteraceae bacterium]
MVSPPSLPLWRQEGYYNAQASFARDLGNDWNFNQGHDVRLDLSNPTAGITLHGPSGSSAFFAYNSTTGTYTDAPGLNATLVKNADGTSTLTFHRSGEKLTFGTNSHLARDTDKNGNSLSYSYNSTHDLLSLTDSQGRVTTLTHNSAYGSSSDPSGQILSLSDPAGRTVQYHYGERGNLANTLTSIIDVRGNTTSFDYSGSDLTSITDPVGNVTTISYLTGDKVGTMTDATGAPITFAYTSGNTVVTDRNGHPTTYTYDPSLKVTAVKDALGHSKSTQFDANYNVTQYGDALNDFSTFVFSSDGRNNLNAIKDGNGAATSFTYPTSGTSNLFYPLTQTDPQGHQTTYAYDSNGNLKSAIDTSTAKGLTYTYNANGTIATMTDADGNVTTYGYDAHGNLIKVTPPATNGSTLKPYTLTVDATTSRVTAVTDGNGNLTSYSYNNFDQINKISYAGGQTITYSYGPRGSLVSEVDNTGTTSFTYDVLQRLKTKTLPGGTVIQSAYDKTGNLTSLDDGGGAVTYGYDAANRMTSLTEPDGAKTTYTYDNADRKTLIQYPNLTGMKMTYDKAGHQLTSIGGTMDNSGTILTTYSSFTYTYTSGTTQTALLQTVKLLDPIGHINSYTRDYSYDSMNRLTNAEVFNSSNQEVEDWGYSYDAAGNRLKASVFSTGASTTYSYNGANELTQTVQGTTTTTYTYDGNGNLLGSSPNGASYTYNTKNQTSKIGSDSFTYSGAGQKDLVQINGDTAVYTGLGLSAYTDGGTTSHYVRCSCGLLNDERTPDGKKYYYLFDGLGSIVGMTDSSGNEVNRYDYDPYGVMLHQQEQSGFTNLFKFAGGQYRSSTGLYKFGERYYDPKLGRWTQLDSAGTGYVYASDDPVNEVDPSGKVSGNCGSASIYVIGGIFQGSVTIVLNLISTWGPISWWGGTLFINSLGSIIPVPVGRTNVNKYVTGADLSYTLPVGITNLVFLGVAGTAGGMCGIVATDTVFVA